MKSLKKRDYKNMQLFMLKRTIVIISIALLSSCSSSINYAPVRYSHAEIQALLADSSFSYLVLQFKSSNGNSNKNPFTLISYAFDTSDNPVVSIPYQLMIDSGSTPKHFSDSLIMGNQMASKQNLLEAITDPGTHAIVSYDYLLFTPKLDSSNHYIYYVITPQKVVPDSTSATTANSVTQPCPPAICKSPIQQ